MGSRSEHKNTAFFETPQNELWDGCKHAKRQAKQSLYQAVADEIKRHIITQGLGPRDPLPTERELCEQMGVSRSSVREAIRILEYLGVVTVKPKEGITVSTPRLKPFLDHLQYMSEIGGVQLSGPVGTAPVHEQICLELSLSTATEQDFGAMEEAIATMEKAITEGKSPMESDFRFHKVLARSTGNPPARQPRGAFWQVLHGRISHVQFSPT